jgi:hypothetical protein
MMPVSLSVVKISPETFLLASVDLLHETPRLLSIETSTKTSC